MKLKNIHKILFITLSNIGDVVLTLPVLSALRTNFPDTKIDIVTGPMPREIFTKDPRVNKIFIYDKLASLRHKISFIKRLREKRYDLAVDMRGSLIPFLISAKNRTRVILMNKSNTKHKKSVHLNKLKSLGIEHKGGRSIYIDAEDRERVNHLLELEGIKKDDILIGVSPACRSLLKQWHAEGFIEVINNLLREKDLKVVLIGDVTNVDVAKKIKDTVMGKRGLIDLIGKTNLNELSALIERMDVLLTCDSACMHIACELGVKVVAIFGPTDPCEYGPTGENDIVIRKKLECVPCRKAVCGSDRECMKEIGAEEVSRAIEEILKEKL